MVGIPGRDGGWIQTYTGRAVFPLDARPEEIDPRDIAHALSNLCRYAGHVNQFYSVAQHCCLVSDWVWMATGDAPAALWGLLHDATEAYLVDLPRPIKLSPGFESYRAAEANLELVIADRFKLEGPMPAIVHEADNRILVDERAALMATPPLPWGADLEGLAIPIHYWSHERAKAEWWRRFCELSPTL